jgi:membrane peptidoglycan carboxypeptidase
MQTRERGMQVQPGVYQRAATTQRYAWLKGYLERLAMEIWVYYKHQEANAVQGNTSCLYKTHKYNLTYYWFLKQVKNTDTTRP